jgi:hypothetical protein
MTNQIDDMDGVSITHGCRNIHQNVIGKSDGKRPLEKPKSRWEDNIEQYLKHTERFVQ